MSQAARRPLVAGNWKMNCAPEAAGILAAELRRDLEEARVLDAIDVVICPPFLALPAVSERLRGSQIRLGAQNMHWADQGAFTGEISPPMLTGICTDVIIGHSERRQMFAETDETVAKKVIAALGHGLRAIVCVGETLGEHDAGDTEAVVRRQVAGAFAGAPDDTPNTVSVAYEPIWAIGTGRAASAEYASATCELIRQALEERFGKAATEIRVLYGGSVTPENAPELMAQPGIDGALVGGASLKAALFAGIAAAAALGREGLALGGTPDRPAPV